jgi:predicted MFS family arabinose efflux permease
VLVPVNLATGSTTIGVGALMALNCVTYLVIIGALILMKPQPVEDFGRPRQKMTESMQEGIRYVRRDPVLRWVIVLAIATALLARPYIQLLPAVAQALHVGAVELSYLLAAAGVGALGGALSSASLGHVRRRGLVLIGASVAMGILLMVFALQRTLIGTIVTVALTSFAAMLFLTIANTLMQTRAPDHLRGRVMSVQTMVFMGLMPLGQLLLGSIGTVTEIGTAFLAGGVIVTALALYVGLTKPALRDFVETMRPRAVARSG